MILKLANDYDKLLTEPKIARRDGTTGPSPDPEIQIRGNEGG